GSNIEVNYHPGYKLYLHPESQNNFDAAHILPSNGESYKESFLAIRSVDDSISPAVYSEISEPATVVGIVIDTLRVPQLQSGPLYATRPDIYGQSTYTFDFDLDVSGNRIPFGMVIYRADEGHILETLYGKDPAKVIKAQLQNDDHIYDRFHELVNYNGTLTEWNNYRLPSPIQHTVAEVNEAILECFYPVMPQPPIYDFIKEGNQTQGIEPVIRDSSGQLLEADNSSFHPFPNIRRLTGTSTIRFTDYRINGGSKNQFFYYCKEVSRKLELGEPSNIIGPVFVINSIPPDAPYIRKIQTILANPYNNILPSVQLFINPYLAIEGISQVKIYRAFNEDDAMSVRTMTLAKTISTTDFSENLIDDFSDMDFPPFAEKLYYRVVALRKIKNEQGQIEYIPSLPSNFITARVLDNINPEAPQLNPFWDETRNPPDDYLLKWNKTVHNGTYYLYKMNESGNWVKIYEIKSNDQEFQYPPKIANSTNPNYTNYPETSNLETYDEDGNFIYYRYRVEVENSSGLFNLTNKELTMTPANFYSLQDWLNISDASTIV
ncbi:MAG: hypothetical protein HYZ42_15695, partial [Bacteroidetes bacterium]|nr:hypothetical protein [Bacteroidota bacterium]